jgi:hypothetical protein
MITALDLPDAEHIFLRDLVKASRQRTHFVAWTDRDGTARQSALTQSDNARVTSLAHRLGISKVELLRRAAHIPVEKPIRPVTSP